MHEMDEDVCNDGGCLRRIVREGDGEPALAGEKVYVHYKSSLLDGTVFEESYKKFYNRQGFSFKLGKGEMIRGWDKGLVGLRVGTKVLLTLRSDYAYAKAPGKLWEFIMGKSKVQAGATLVYEVHLLSVGQEPSIEMMKQSEYGEYFQQFAEHDENAFGAFAEGGLANLDRAMLRKFASKNPVEAVSYVVTGVCTLLALLAALWPLPWVVLWKGPFSTVGTLLMFWRWPWPWLSSGTEIIAVGGGTTNRSNIMQPVDEYQSCLYEIGWRMWLTWLALLLGLFIMFKIMIFKIYGARLDEDYGWKFAYGRLSKIYYFFLTASVGANIAMFDFLNTDCPLLAPRLGENAAEGMRHATESIWFGWSFVFTSRLLLYSLMLALWPLLAILIYFDDKGSNAKQRS